MKLKFVGGDRPSRLLPQRMVAEIWTEARELVRDDARHSAHSGMFESAWRGLC